MGIRINKAIGYGMPWKEFTQFSPLSDQLRDSSFYEVFKDEDGCKFNEPFISDSDEFKTKYALHDKQFLSFKIAEEKTISDLIYMIGYDDPEHILFMPSEYHIKKWYRYDDGIDYAERRWPNKDNLTRKYEGNGHLDEIKYLPYGHYPYTNNLMDTLGNHVKWTNFMDFYDKEDSIIPEPPSSIVYYTQKLGILNKAGVLRLKPMIATWWR